MKIKLLFIILFVFCFGLISKSSAIAQSNQYPMRTNPDVPQNFHTYTQNVVLELLAATSCIITGTDPLNQNGKCLGIDPKTKKIGYVENKGGAIGMMGNLIAKTYEIPISGTHFAKDLANNFGIAKKSYAGTPCDALPIGSLQHTECLTNLADSPNNPTSTSLGTGIGFNGLLPLIDLWKTFRNIVYLFFVLIFLFVGIGIMFRIKIDPRTVMTMQNQIPKIIIALVLVTFSYAIAGFLIDMMYILIYLMFNVFAPHISDSSNYTPGAIQGKNPISAVGLVGGLGMVWSVSSGIGNILGSLFDGSMGKLIATVMGTIIGGGIGAIGGPVGIAIGAGVGLATGGFAGGKIIEMVGGLIAFIVIGAAILTALFRLWFQLIKAYIFIMINTVIAPFWIAGGLIPGSTKNFGMWLRDMIGNLSAFPATLFMFLIGKIFIDAFGKNANTMNNQFAPPLIGNPGDQDNFGAIIGVGIILLTPQVVTMVRAAIKAPEGKYSSAVGGAISAGAGMSKEALSPAGRNLFGRKDPYTGKRMGGVARFGAKRLGSKLADKYAGDSSPIAVLKKPFSKWRSWGERATIEDKRRIHGIDDRTRSTEEAPSGGVAAGTGAATTGASGETTATDTGTPTTPAAPATGSPARPAVDPSSVAHAPATPPPSTEGEDNDDRYNPV